MSEHRYPFAPLAQAMDPPIPANSGGGHASIEQRLEHRAAKALGLSGSTELAYRRNGMTLRVADRLAVKAGLHPFEVWPEMVDHAIADSLEPCQARGCSESFHRRHPLQRYCSVRCRNREQGRKNMARRYRNRPAVAEAKRAARRAYYAECGEYERARERRRYAERKAGS